MIGISTTLGREWFEERIRSVRLMAFDFDGVFTDNMVYVLEDGSEAVRCFRGDGIGLRKLERLGIRTLIISSEENPVVSVRSRKLRISCLQGCEDKLAVLERTAAEMNIGMENIAFVGNDVNDLHCLQSVGLPIVVLDAHQDVVNYGCYRTSTLGGHGAVREICDLFEQVLQSEPRIVGSGTVQP